MILADTSVWVNHFRRANQRFRELLEQGQVLVHPFIIGELVCGNLRNREQILGDLERLPHAIVATQAETLHLIERHRLHGTGIGWVDAHLLSSALLSDWRLWSTDRRLHETAALLGVHYP